MTDKKDSITYTLASQDEGAQNIAWTFTASVDAAAEVDISELVDKLVEATSYGNGDTFIDAGYKLYIVGNDEDTSGGDGGSGDPEAPGH